MNATDLPALLYDISKIMDKVKTLEKAGSLIRELEAGPRSFIQLIEAVPLVKGSVEPVTWRYHQNWIDKMPPENQEKLIGAYLNEWIGQCKVLGIFTVASPK